MPFLAEIVLMQRSNPLQKKKKTSSCLLPIESSNNYFNVYNSNNPFLSQNGFILLTGHFPVDKPEKFFLCKIKLISHF